MNKKGFTLIELLAVIVILAIIALIATPAVLNIIEDSRKGAAEASARNIASAAETYYIQQMMNGTTIGNIDIESGKIEYDGEQADKGYIEFDNKGNGSGVIYINGYCVTINKNGSVSSEKMDAEECKTSLESTEYTVYTNGAPVYFNPNENRKCSATEVETNVNTYKENHYYEDSYGEGNIASLAGLNSGCMQWHAFLDSKDSSKVKLILDHNTTGQIEDTIDYVVDNNDIIAQLNSDIAAWNTNVKSTVRLISAEEINQIAPNESTHNWDVNDEWSGYHFTTGITLADKGGYWYSYANGVSPHDWLFNNTAHCDSYGCSINDLGTDGYYTSTYNDEKNFSWIITLEGVLGTTEFMGYGWHYSGLYGIRPVITVDKSIFE